MNIQPGDKAIYFDYNGNRAMGVVLDTETVPDHIEITCTGGSVFIRRNDVRKGF